VVTQNGLEIETKDFQDEFPNIISIGYGSSLSVTKENRTFLLSIARELCNWELCLSVQDCFEGNLSVSEFCKTFGESVEFEHLSERGIEFLASHFFELDSSFIDGLPSFQRLLSCTAPPPRPQQNQFTRPLAGMRFC
jgi:hypothetical protein